MEEKESSDEPSSSWSVEELKEYLRRSGAFVTGKKKELLER